MIFYLYRLKNRLRFLLNQYENCIKLLNKFLRLKKPTNLFLLTPIFEMKIYEKFLQIKNYCYNY